MTLDSVARILEEAGAKRLDPAHRVYELRAALWPPVRRAADLHARQVELLDAIRLMPWSALYRGAEDPTAWDVPGPWTPSGPETWLLPEDGTGEALLAGALSYGAWQIYLREEAVDPATVPNLFETEPGVAVAWVETHGVPVLVDAWHDNTSWRVVLEPTVVPRVAAA